MEAFSQFERAVLEFIVRGDDVLLNVLALQVQQAQVRDREHTGTGCFVNLELPADVPLLSVPRFHVGDVHLEVEGCEHGAAAILFVADGRALFLELVAYTGPWPQDPVLTAIHHMSSEGLRDRRDMSEFRRMAGLP